MYCTCLHIPCFIHLKKKQQQQQKQQKQQQQQYNYCEMHCMRKRVHLFYIEVNMSYHVPLQWNALRFEKNARGKRNNHFKEMHHSFQGNHLKCLNMCWLEGFTKQCQYPYPNQFCKCIGCLCFCTVFDTCWKISQKQNCLIHVPSP
jgi:hypothetical protein